MLGPAAPGLNRYCADGKRLAHPAGLTAAVQCPVSLICNLLICNALRICARRVQELSSLKAALS